MDRMWTVFASCLLVGMIVMLTLNVDLIRENVIFDAKEIISSVLQRSKRATSDKPARVFGKCGGEQYGRTGWIATPNFPGSSYPALSKCNWTITVYPRMVIKFEFEYMDLEEAPVQKRGSCQADYLELREGRKSTDPLVGGQKYCGKTTKFNPVYSTTSKVYAYFHSDARDEGEGFAVKWTASDPPADAFNCDFEDINDMCIGWEQSKNDKFDWALHHGRTQSGLTTETGPIKDHTTDSDLGFYAYIEASGQRNGDKAVLISPKVRIHHPAGHCFRFWYHMRGTSMGTLNVYQQEVVPGMNTTAELIFNRTGNLGLNWRRAAINITNTAAKRIRFLFEGVRGSSFRGDMAIDDISLSKGPCPAPIVTTTTTTTTTATTTTAKTRKPKKTPKPTRKTTTKPPPPPLTTPRTTPAEKCAGMYTCSEVGNCVEFQYFCDGLQDCLHKDDEKDCGDEDGTSTAKPSVTKWDPWSSWSVCTKSCGAGTTERSRKCDNGIVDSVLGCIGTAIEAMECNTHKCMQWAAWQKWTDCSATCGEGVRTRDRICLGGNPGERGCIGPTVQVDFCNEHNCPQWGKWSKWGPCEGTCKQGTTVKSRTCEGGQIGDKGCTGKATKTKECLREDLPSCGAEWADWQPWTDCSVTCNTGIKIRHRTCDGAEPGEQGCIGPTIEEDSCNAHPCPSWEPWSQWGPCESTCKNGTSLRSRSCKEGQVGDTGCQGDANEERNCIRDDLLPCPEWTPWQSWMDCTTTCGGGMHARSRICLGGEQGDRGCIGDNTEAGVCNEHNCPKWGEWAEWGSCEATCEKGTSVRRRTCEGGQIGDNGCNGDATETKDCVRDDLPPCAEWADWQPWKHCSVTCGGGIKMRDRTCDGAEPGKQGCLGPSIGVDVCNTHSCPRWEQWGAWGVCEASCKKGASVRTRICKGGQIGDQGCEGDATETKDCIRDDLPPCTGWTEWSTFGECTVTCGGGLMTKTRQCIKDDANPTACEGDGYEMKECGTDACPALKPMWTTWGNWSECSLPCGGGYTGRRRQCLVGDVESKRCRGRKVNSRVCNRIKCPTLSCHVGLSSTTGNFDVVNNFKLTECPDAPLTPRTKDGSGRTGLQCSMVTIKVEHGGFMVDMMQGACFTDDMCQSLTCDEYKRMIKLYDVQSCEIQCCTKDGCNNPKHFKPTTATPTGDPCSTNPCKNGGECIRSPSNGMDYTCACKHGFHGMNCDSGTSRICYTGVSTRERLKPSGSPMLPTSCAAADDSCLVATVSAYQNAEKIIVDTAQCVKPEVCQALTCEDLKRTMPKFDIESCKITCCNKDECNQASLDLPVVTTTPYPRATTRKPKPKTTRKPPPKTTKKPKTKKPKTTPKPTKKPKRTNKPKTSSEASTASPTGVHWSEWQAWQQCTHRCGSDGTRQRFRFCVNGGPGMPGCSPVTDMMGKEKCNTDVSCVRWREWNHWQSCSRSCGGGTQERRRSCDGGPPNTPGCMGDEMETQNCNQQSCETTTQQTQTTTTPSTTQQSRTRWGEWGRWGVCSTSCDKGIQLRSRECIGGKAGRRGCRGSKVEKQDCNERRCEVVTEAKTTTQAPQSGPVWGEWSDWEQCSATCGPGTTSRSRTCIGAKRRRRCKGQKSDTRSCAVKACEDTGPDKPDAACLQRNVRLARRKGRKCPIGCSSDGECGQGKQCVCDGLCGKTCQEKDKKCRNILSSTPEGTVLSCSNGIFVGSKCTYSCKDGYELQGNADIFCQGTSKWTNEKSMPKCIGTTDRSSTGTTSAEQSCKFKVRAHDSCCGKVSYFSKKARCCSGKAKPAGPAMTECCFQTPYDPLKKGCCGKRLFPLSNKKCKDGKIVNK